MTIEEIYQEGINTGRDSNAVLQKMYENMDIMSQHGHDEASMDKFTRQVTGTMSVDDVYDEGFSYTESTSDTLDTMYKHKDVLKSKFGITETEIDNLAKKKLVASAGIDEIADAGDFLRQWARGIARIPLGLGKVFTDATGIDSTYVDEAIKANEQSIENYNKKHDAIVQPATGGQMLGEFYLPAGYTVKAVKSGRYLNSLKTSIPGSALAVGGGEYVVAKGKGETTEEAVEAAKTGAAIGAAVPIVSNFLVLGALAKGSDNIDEAAEFLQKHLGLSDDEVANMMAKSREVLEDEGSTVEQRVRAMIEGSGKAGEEVKSALMLLDPTFIEKQRLSAKELTKQVQELTSGDIGEIGAAIDKQAAFASKLYADGAELLRQNDKTLVMSDAEDFFNALRQRVIDNENIMRPELQKKVLKNMEDYASGKEPLKISTLINLRKDLGDLNVPLKQKRAGRDKKIIMDDLSTRIYDNLEDTMKPMWKDMNSQYRIKSMLDMKNVGGEFKINDIIHNYNNKKISLPQMIDNLKSLGETGEAPFATIAKAVGPEEAAKFEKNIIGAFMKPVKGTNVIDMPKAMEMLDKYDFVTAEGKKLKETMETLSHTFNSEKILSQHDRTLRDLAAGTLDSTAITANLLSKFKYAGMSKFWTVLRRYNLWSEDTLKYRHLKKITEAMSGERKFKDLDPVEAKVADEVAETLFQLDREAIRLNQELARVGDPQQKTLLLEEYINRPMFVDGRGNIRPDLIEGKGVVREMNQRATAPKEILYPQVMSPQSNIVGEPPVIDSSGQMFRSLKDAGAIDAELADSDLLARTVDRVNLDSALGFDERMLEAGDEVRKAMLKSAKSEAVKSKIRQAYKAYRDNVEGGTRQQQAQAYSEFMKLWTGVEKLKKQRWE